MNNSNLDEQIKKLEAEFAIIIKACNDWEHHVHEDFNGYGCMAILGMHAYHLNRERGFCDANDESHYQHNLARDKDGKLMEATMHWVSLSLTARRLCDQIKKLKIDRGDYKPNNKRKLKT